MSSGKLEIFFKDYLSIFQKKSQKAISKCDRGRISLQLYW